MRLRKGGTEEILLFAQLSFGKLAVCDIASNFRGADDSALGILHGRNSQGDIEAFSVFRGPDRFEVLDTFSTPEALKDLCFFLSQLRRNDDGDWLPDGFLGGIAEDTFRSSVPTLNNPV